jgi:hypothetical protein
MIELIPAKHDDVAFLSLVQRIINGAIAEPQVREVFLVYIDNWFDHKWLGWCSRKGEEELRVPLFTRALLAENDGERLQWIEKGLSASPDAETKASCSSTRPCCSTSAARRMPR